MADSTDFVKKKIVERKRIIETDHPERRGTIPPETILENILRASSLPAGSSAGSAIVIVLSLEKRLTLIDVEVSRTAGSTVYTY